MGVNLEQLKEYARLNVEMKELKKEMDDLKKDIKDDMLASNKKSIDCEGTKFSLSESTRRTCYDKKGLMTFLYNKGLKHCINIVTEPNYDRMEDEINVGNLAKDDYNKYIKEAKIYTFRVK